MITGFNTDVSHEDRVYHVQTEDRGRDNPVLESLVYVGGTIVAKKSTPYADKIREGATEEIIAALLKRQHQVIIAAIKAGRVEELIKHSAQENQKEPSRKAKSSLPPSPAPELAVAGVAPPDKPRRRSKERPAPSGLLDAPARAKTSGALSAPAKALTSGPLAPPAQARASGMLNKPATASGKSPTGMTGGLNLDEFINDYLRRNAEQGKLDLKVLSPDTFVAGRTISLRVQVSQSGIAEPDATVTIKIIGTAFKPQVYIGRAMRDGVAAFNFTLPSFKAGTAAIVIEAQSNRGRGELKHLIRRG